MLLDAVLFPVLVLCFGFRVASSVSRFGFQVEFRVSGFRFRVSVPSAANSGGATLAGISILLEPVLSPALVLFFGSQVQGFGFQ